MENKFAAATGILLACLFLTNLSFAQSANAAFTGEGSNGITQENVIKTDDLLVEINRESVTEKAIRSFREQFKDGPEPQWFLFGNNYLALFEKEERMTRALFAKNGYVFYTLTYGTEKNLPAAVKALINDQYRGYSIGCVQDVYSQGAKAWVANLRQNENLLVVSVVDRSINVLFDNRDLPAGKAGKKDKTTSKHP